MITSASHLSLRWFSHITPHVRRAFRGGEPRNKIKNAACDPLLPPCCPETDVSAQLSTTERASEESLHGVIHLAFIIFLLMMFSQFHEKSHNGILL